MDLISKKDLLAATGISYGQLYRWKREKLIPEEWFIKRPSYTGQETFFPRDQILSRVQTILSAKDKYSLEELSRLFSPESASHFCTMEELSDWPELSPELLSALPGVWGNGPYTFDQAVLLTALSQAARRLPIEASQLPILLVRLRSAAGEVTNLQEMTLTLFRAGEELHVLLSKTAVPTALDGDLPLLGRWDLGHLAGQLKLNHPIH